jgi:hypothetical protein
MTDSSFRISSRAFTSVFGTTVLHDDSGALSELIATGLPCILPPQTTLNLASPISLTINGQTLAGANSAAPAAGTTLRYLTPGFAIFLQGQRLRLANLVLSVLDAGIDVGLSECDKPSSFLANTIENLQIYGASSSLDIASVGIRIESPFGTKCANYFHFVANNFTSGFAVALYVRGNAEIVDGLTATGYTRVAANISGSENQIRGLFCNSSAASESFPSQCVRLEPEATFNTVDYKMEAGPNSQGYILSRGSHGNLIIATDNGGRPSQNLGDGNTILSLGNSSISLERATFSFLEGKCRNVAALPKSPPDGTMVCVSDWDGHGPDCNGHSAHYGLALFGAGSWTCH